MLAQGGFASTLNINSINYDNSGSILSINSFDNEDFNFDVKPQLYIDSANKKAYIDISPAVLNCPLQNIVLNNSEINQITVSQQSRAEEVVRIAFAYSDKFNPNNVQLRKLNNTIFIRFKNPTINNYYFQGAYLENKDANLFEAATIETPVQVGTDSLLGQINSAFDIGSAKNYVLVKKNMILRSKYYLDCINFNSGYPVIFGTGAYTLTRPFQLTNPNRIVYDIHNAVVNPAIRNKSFTYGSDAIKIGQFDTNTVRIVITTQNPQKYTPVIFADTQRLAFVDKTNFQIIENTQVAMTSSKYDKISSNVHSIKLFFNNPVIFGIDRNEKDLELNLYNVGNYNQDLLKKSIAKTPFENIKISNSNGELKLLFPIDNQSKTDIHIGADGKTLRLKETLPKQEIETPVMTMPELNLSEIVPALRKDNKKYIVIDAGHGGSDCGAIRGNINEKEITLDIAKRVEKLLTKKGYAVTMTRTTDATVSLQERVDISEAIMPDIFVSIHVNSSNSETPSGLETHYYKDNSLGLAKCVHASMLNNINSNDRGLFKSKFYVINHTTAPAILVEIGFLSNPKERSQLITESRKDATAKAIVEGIDEYFK